MKWRITYWLTGPALIVLLAGLARGDQRDLVRILAFALWVSWGLALEVGSLVRDVKSKAARPVQGPRPADGRVEITSVRNMTVEPFPLDVRFQRLVQKLNPSRNSSVPLACGSVPRPTAPLGHIALGSFFIGRDGRAWTDREIADTLNALARAARWVEAEAALWSAPLNVSQLSPFVVGMDASPRTPGVLLKGIEEHQSALFDPTESAQLLHAAGAIATEHGFASLLDLINTFSANVDADLVIWYLHSLSQGRSHLLAEEEGPALAPRAAICYAREDEPPDRWSGTVVPDPCTFAHELMHAFGATDKYGVSSSHFPPGEVSPHDIMRLDMNRLSQLRIDPMTARELGWWSGQKLPDPIAKRARRARRRTRLSDGHPGDVPER